MDRLQRPRALAALILLSVLLTGCSANTGTDNKLTITKVYEIQSKLVNISLEAVDYIYSFDAGSIGTKKLNNRIVILEGQLRFQEKLIDQKNTGGYTRELNGLAQSISELLEYCKEAAGNGTVDKERMEALLSRIAEQNNNISERLKVNRS